METATPLVTVLLPTYNRRELLPDAIRSIRNQTFRDWRLLVLDDGGDDVSDVVAGFGDPRVECVPLPHRGKAAALNAGLALVRSEYVAYMDDDDIVYPDHLALLVSLAEREGAEFVYSDTWDVWIGPDGKERRRLVENDADVSFGDLRLSNRINHKQILHTKRLADEAGPYDERLRVLVDYDYVRRLAKIAAPVHLRKVTGEHFLRQSSDRAEDYSSISGLWVSDPAACGRSVAAVFEKDPAALAEIWRRSGLLDVEKERHAETRKALLGAAARIRALESSLSYRLGMALTAPLRRIAERIRRRPVRN
jgi:glycosyltransferase involved in cell wall biosynthesis